MPVSRGASMQKQTHGESWKEHGSSNLCHELPPFNVAGWQRESQRLQIRQTRGLEGRSSQFDLLGGKKRWEKTTPKNSFPLWRLWTVLQKVVSFEMETNALGRKEYGLSTLLQLSVDYETHQSSQKDQVFFDNTMNIHVNKWTDNSEQSAWGGTPVDWSWHKALGIIDKSSWFFIQTAAEGQNLPIVCY